MVGNEGRTERLLRSLGSLHPGGRLSPPPREKLQPGWVRPGFCPPAGLAQPDKHPSARVSFEKQRLGEEQFSWGQRASRLRGVLEERRCQGMFLPGDVWKTIIVSLTAAG